MEERRRFPRYEVGLEARIYSADINLSVTVLDISERGIGIISDEPIETGIQVFISIFPINEDPLKGIPVWLRYIEKEKKYHYRIGLETEQISLDKIKALGYPIE